MGRETAERKEAGIGKRYWEEKESKRTGIILGGEKDNEKNRKQKGLKILWRKKILERVRIQKGWIISWRKR